MADAPALPLRVYCLARPGGQDGAPFLEQAIEGIDVVQVPEDGPLPAASGGAEVLVGHSRPTPALEQALARPVAWVHLLGTGVEHFPFHLVQPGTVVTCSRGISAVPISEWTLAMMLAFAKRLPDSWATDAPEHWAYAELDLLRGRTLGLVGFGSIASRVARLALAFEMRVIAYRRSGRRSDVEGVEIVRSLEELLPQADHLMLAAPATPETRHIIGREALALVKPGVHLINIARGVLVDQKALREALDDGRVARASLDTVDPEPLPAGHWLYSHPRVKLSPHISWMRPGVYGEMLDPAIENLRHYLAGEPLEGIVDVEAGY
jgi:phosphoglycerate dehydrogenase-like enzyme